MTKRRPYLSVGLMLLAIVALAIFQIYWLRKTFQEEKDELYFRTNVLFSEAIQRVQAEKLGLDTGAGIRSVRAGTVNMLGAMRRRVSDTFFRGPVHARAGGSTQKRVEFFKTDIRPGDSMKRGIMMSSDRGDPAVLNIFTNLVSLPDTITVTELSVRYAQLLAQERIDLPFTITRRVETPESINLPPEMEKTNEASIGFTNPVTYRADLQNTTGFVLQKMTGQIIVSILLVGVTILSFALLLRSLVHQRRLTRIKNDFISNITHELKTPIATVSVAIEALRNFDALQDPQKTKEYLVISSNELQRLSFLVDKVLKLSMFEKQQIELKEEQIDLSQLTNEVVSSMRLQFEKYKAQVSVQLHGKDFTIHADRLHITSVLFNLLDNALKYSQGVPSIKVDLTEHVNEVELNVTDNGIGIPAEYKKKIFDKFFRVPAGNTHNVKGYGLGLSYVAYVVQRHYGSIEVESQPGIGSRFIVKLPSTT